MAIKKITSEEIIESALNFIKEKGYENLNARSLASHLKCSTQPIYFQFQNMNDLKLNVLKKENTLFMGCLKGMINYAKEYKNIFFFIFEKDYVKTPEEDKFNKQIVEGIMKAGGYSFEDALMFFNQSWIFSYGIACGIINGYMMFSDEEIDSLLKHQFEALKLYYKRN